MKKLPNNIDNVISEIIKTIQKEEQLEILTLNKLIKDDVLFLLDHYCVVVYYPLRNESNNGFHTSVTDKEGKKINFVYINTAQTIEKQVFTAAHELGHVWNVYAKIIEKIPELKIIEEETIINRFAAELLMPHNLFIKACDDEYNKHESTEGALLLSDFLDIVVSLMNQFFAPLKAVLFRMFELNRIKENTLIQVRAYLEKNAVNDYIVSILKEKGLDKFIKPDNRKYINGLADLLDKARRSNFLSREKINNLQHIFDLPDMNGFNCVFENRVDLSKVKGDN